MLAAEDEIILKPSKKKLSIGEEFKVEVLINTEKNLVGADAQIKFDPSIFEVVLIESGEAFSQVPLKTIKEGIINITALSETSKKFTGSSTLAVLHLKTKDAAKTDLKLTFTNASTVDSNLTAPDVRDVLSGVSDSKVTIGTGPQIQASTLKRFFFRIVPIILLLSVASFFALFAYRWWKYKKSLEGLFIPEHPPMNILPQSEQSVSLISNQRGGVQNKIKAKQG